MKNLVLYSDQIPPLADKIDKQLITLLARRNPMVGYIPSSADPQRRHFKDRQAYYARMGMHLHIYFELDKEFRPDLLESLLSCDAIHLSGGNAYYFLHWLRKREMLEPLRQYVKRGGVLVGVSAGSILMSPDISICRLYRNEPTKAETDLSALNLVDFAFAPHYGSRGISTEALRKYSRKRHIAVYACQDSGGIVVAGDDVRCIGDVYEIDER